MLKPIPSKILTHSGLLKVPTGTDRYGEPNYAEYNLTRINIQASNAVIKSKDNKEVVLRSILFFDIRNSRPLGLDLVTLKNQADSHNSQIKILCGSNTYTVESVDSLTDDRGKLHHYQIGLT